MSLFCTSQNKWCIGVYLVPVVYWNKWLVCKYYQSEQVVYLVENETLGLHLLSVGTSSRFSQNK